MRRVVYDPDLARRHREAQMFRQHLVKNKACVTRQEFTTLWGQARAGDIEGAERGLAKLIRRYYGYD